MAPRPPRDPWLIYGGQYREVSALDQPWVPSPSSSPPNDHPWNTLPLPLDTYPASPPTSTSSSHSSAQNTRYSFLRRILAFRRLLRARRSQAATNAPEHSNARQAYVVTKPLYDPVPLSEWKAYGYFACPFVNGLNVYNDSPEPAAIPPQTIDVRDAFDSLAKDDPFWIRGTQHSALPPRPSRWTEPNPLDPLPFPFECQLNPHLEHKLFGLPPLIFNLGLHPSVIMYAGVGAAIPLLPSDRAQPATYPFLTHMFINAIADDPLENFPWPIMVVKEQGIRVGDVFSAIYNNFQLYVSRTEYNSWPQTRRNQCAAARRARITAANGTLPDNEPLRRIDYMGDLVMFRGLQANPDISTSSWVISVGRAWS